MLQDLRRKEYYDSYIRVTRGMLTQIFKRAQAYQMVIYNPGVKQETISHLVGHATTRITENKNLRVQEEICRDALEGFDQRFGIAT